MFKKTESKPLFAPSLAAGNNQSNAEFTEASEPDSDPALRLQGLSESQVLAYLESLQSELAQESEGCYEQEKGALEEAKAQLMMTKYQMLFVKIEVYLVNLARVLRNKFRKLMLQAFLEVKLMARSKGKGRGIVACGFFFKGMVFFEGMEAIFERNRVRSQIKAFAVLSLPGTPVEQSEKAEPERPGYRRLPRSNSESRAEYPGSSLRMLPAPADSDEPSATRLSRLLKDSSHGHLHLRRQASRNELLSAKLKQTNRFALNLIAEMNALMSAKQ